MHRAIFQLNFKMPYDGSWICFKLSQGKILLKEKVHFCCITQALQWGSKQVFVDPAVVGLRSLCPALQALKMLVLNSLNVRVANLRFLWDRKQLSYRFLVESLSPFFFILQTKELISTMKVNGRCTASAFTPDSSKIYSYSSEYSNSSNHNSI